MKDEMQHGQSSDLFPFNARTLRWLIPVLAAAIGLRLLFILRYSFIPVDATIYADIAKTWLHHHVYGFGDIATEPTLIRLPGYPAFLALIFAIFGIDHYFPIYITQLLFDLGTCVLVAYLARDLFGERAGRVAFAIAALCPFTANYVALALTETLAVFSVALASWLLVRTVRRENVREAIYCGLACSFSILLRPDNGILPAAFLLYLVWRAMWLRSRLLMTAAVLLGCFAALPFVPWTIRNWNTFHQIQPLVPRYANAPGELVPLGFNRWTKSWLADYVSVEEIFWKVSTDVPGEPLDLGKLPDRAFDSRQEREQAAELFSEYNRTLLLTPELDAGFGELARQRIERHPARYYLVLPALRIADMWFRPRTETLPIEGRWWEFEDVKESWFAIAYASLDIALVFLGCCGLFRFRNVSGWAALLGYIALRSAFLGTMENPEPRYTLECFPVIFVFAAGALSGGRDFRPVFHAKVRTEMLR